MSWRHRISLVLLMVLTGLPVSGTVCAMLCDSATASRAGAHHHGSGKACDEDATTPSGPQLGGGSSHDCSDHDPSVGETPTISATRADSMPGPSLLTSAASRETAIDSHASHDIFDYRTSSASAPPTASPLVLRV